MRRQATRPAKHAQARKTARRTLIRKATLGILAVVAGRYVYGQPQAYAQGAAPRLKFGLSSPITTVDPRYSDTIQNDGIVDTIYDQLLGRQFPGGKVGLVPRLATSWERVDNQTIQFKLRPGVVFADGETVNAEAVKYSLDTVYQKSYGAVRAYLTPTIASVDVVDEMTVRVRTAQPDRAIITNLSQLDVMPPQMGARLGRGMTTQAAGTGPYQVDQFVPSQSLKLKPYDKYWSTPKPRLSGIDISLIVDDGTRTAALLAGDVQLVNNLPVDQIDRVRQSGKFRVLEAGTSRIVYIGMREDRGPLKDVRVRQALNYAVDKNAIVKNILKGHATVANSPLAPIVEFANPNLKPYPYDPPKAKALLAAANYPSNFTLKFACPTGRYLGDRATGEAVAGYFDAIGVKVDFDSPEWGVLAGEVFGKGPQSKYDIWLAAQSASTPDSLLRLRFHSSFNEKWMAYKDPQVDALLDAGLATLNDNQARLIYYKAQEQIMSDAPWVFLHYVNSIFGADARVHYTVRPDEYIFFHDTWIG
jgi:peptide/nickel transport system substrate-binding protein